MAVLLSVLVWLTLGYVTSRFAIQRGRDPVIWFGLGMLGGIFALAALFIMPAVDEEENKQEQAEPVSEIENKYSELEEAEWFYLGVDDIQKGPVDYEDLLLAWADGVVKEKTYVWREGMADWLHVEKVDSLLDKLKLDQKNVE
ncbi:MAG: DUF4339 domain-containing protein [Chlamydiota bacterium]|nr:DUF4339 domain-containing protein [Chlamydiota bacterium]